ncbi:MAG TPA: 30S ribosomal protein S7 [Firmicutes bacterium]|jgi:small subunit ribosomal protein S7|nr:30S ribosomal protein S7 [Bacillota bacterium]
MRKRQAVKREVLADPIYNSKMVTKLINRIMIGGKKGTAQNILYDAFDIVKEKTGNDPMETFNKAYENIKPQLEIKSRRIGGGNYQVPVEVKEDRGQALALRWLVQYAKNRSGKGMAENLANEIIDAANGVGGAVKKREDTHKMAEANKAYAHYRW